MALVLSCVQFSENKIVIVFLIENYNAKPQQLFVATQKTDKLSLFIVFYSNISELSHCTNITVLYRPIVLPHQSTDAFEEL